MAKTFQVDTGGTLTTNLVSYYKLEDVNDFWASYNLTNNNSVAFNTGKVNNAADFGASNTNKSLTIADNLGIDGGNCSLSAWVNVTTAPTSGNYMVLVSQYSDTSSKVAYQIAYFNDAGTLKLLFGRERVAVAADRIYYTTTLTTGNWYHLAITYDGTNLRAYYNGSLVESPIAASGNGAGTRSSLLSVGVAYTAVNDFYSGLVDEFGVWSKALSATEITDLYNSGNGQTMIEGFIPQVIII